MTVLKNEPQAIPGYQMLRVLGVGGMATVYLAHQDSVDREVALKLMSRHLLVDPRFAERFLREARIAAKLQHRHVVSIFDVGVANEQPYIAMEYLSGGQVMPHDEEPLSVDQALRCVFEIALALDYAHGKGYIHRDVKPDNILLRDDNSCVLSDFGIARTVDSATMMTRTGSIVGTPFYMSPEQLRGKEVDGRADLYSLGVVFYQLLTGKVPYTASDSLAIGIMHMTAPMPRLPQHYQHLQPLLERMMSKEASDRVQTGRELAELVRQAQHQMGTLDPQRYIRTQPQTAISAPVGPAVGTRKAVPVGAKGHAGAERRDPEFVGAISSSLANAGEGRIEPRFGAAAPVLPEVRGEQSAAKPNPPPAAQRANVAPSLPSGKAPERSLPASVRIEPSFGKANPANAQRPEPVFGQIDPAMDRAAWRKPAPTRAQSPSLWPLLLGASLVAGVGLAYVKRDEVLAAGISRRAKRCAKRHTHPSTGRTSAGPLV
jgi:serine/threonine protein kinase